MTCLKTVGRYLLLHLPLYPAAERRQELELLNGSIRRASGNVPHLLGTSQDGRNREKNLKRS